LEGSAQNTHGTQRKPTPLHNKKEIWTINKDRTQHSDSGRLEYSSITNRKVIQTKKKINKETLELNDTIDQMDLTVIYSVFHPATAQYTFFLAAHVTFSKIDHILDHKASLFCFLYLLYKKIEIIPTYYLITME
jgi:ribosomal protein S10